MLLALLFRSSANTADGRHSLPVRFAVTSSRAADFAVRSDLLQFSHRPSFCSAAGLRELA